MSSGNGGDKDREMYFREQQRRLTIVAEELRRRVGAIGAAGILVGAGRGILHAEFGEVVGDRYLKACVEEVATEPEATA